MWIGILGWPEARGDDGRPIDVGGARVRALLARLALDAGHTVPADSLIDDLWGAAAPSAAQNALQSLAARLRRALSKGDVHRVLLSERGGYHLAVSEADVDAHRFEHLTKMGRRALAEEQYETAARSLWDAERLWRGPALSGLGEPPFAAAPTARLVELRLQATEARIDAELAQGRHSAVVAEVERLAAEHPLRERLQGRLMRVLYASGRQSEALTVYERVRAALADELGADPSQDLAAIHLAVLRHAPELTPDDPTAVSNTDLADAPPSDSQEPTPVSSTPATPIAPLTTFVGREKELCHLRSMLDDARLVTIVGPGGAGKSRMAAELLTQADHAHDDAWFVELASLTDSTDLLQGVMVRLGIREHPLIDRPNVATARILGDAFTRLTETVRDRRVLLVLDNCEHVVDAAASLTHRLLAACPQLRILATSREPLGLTGERQLPIAPLAVPDEGTVAVDAVSSPAIRLFHECAVGVRPTFTITDDNIAAVIEICRRLDGMPLAIELAAAKVKILSPTQIASRLDDRFRLLTQGSRLALPRHQTLHAVVEWSWDLLEEPERALARRLSVFPGGATLPAIEEVCSGGDLPRARVLDVLGSLVEKSLVESVESATPATSEMRYRMLETVRAFGAERLSEAGETARLQERCARYFMELAEHMEPQMRTGEQLRCLAILRAEHTNLHTAVRWAIDVQETGIAIRLCAALVWYWLMHGGYEPRTIVDEVIALPGDELLVEQGVVVFAHVIFESDYGDADLGRHDIAQIRARLRDADTTSHPFLALLEPMMALFVEKDPLRALRELERIGTQRDTWTRAALLMTRGFLRDGEGDTTGAWQDLSAARALFAQLGDEWGLAMTGQGVAAAHSLNGDFDQAVTIYREAVSNLENLGALEDVPALRAQVGHELVQAGDDDGGRGELTHALELADRYGMSEAMAWARGGLGSLARSLGDLDAADRYYRDALATPLPRGGFDHRLAALHTGIAGVGIQRGELDEARGHLRDAVVLTLEIRGMAELAAAVHGLAALALTEGDPEHAAFLTGAADRVRGARDLGNPTPARVEAEAREQLGDAAYDGAYQRGATMSREAAVAHVRAMTGVEE